MYEAKDENSCTMEGHMQISKLFAHCARMRVLLTYPPSVTSYKETTTLSMLGIEHSFTFDPDDL